MSQTLPQREPIRNYARKASAKRRLGVDARCKCGETRPEALTRKKNVVTCAECDRKLHGKSTLDQHHVAGKSNSPICVSTPANDHRSQLSSEQYEWPKQTLENPHRSPLLAAAACIRGFIDTVLYLIEKLLRWIALMLERLDGHLVERLGFQWWINTEFSTFAPGVFNERE